MRWGVTMNNWTKASMIILALILILVIRIPGTI